MVRAPCKIKEIINLKCTFIHYFNQIMLRKHKSHAKSFETPYLAEHQGRGLLHFKYRITEKIIPWFIKKNPTRCNNASKFYYSIFIWSSTSFGRHTAHHQEPKTALAASGFSYVEGCWTCSWWRLTTSTNYTSTNLPHKKNPEAASAILGSWWWAVCCPKHVEFHINME